MTIRSMFLASALVLSAAVPASAAGENVVLIAVDKVAPPTRLPGLCQVTGVVTNVLDGKAFRAGQALGLKVPCSAGNSYMTPVSTGQEQRFISVDVLLKSREGMAHIDDGGALIWEHANRSYGGMSNVSGYRVLDGTLMPVPGRSNS
jgi:hypothetical protein